MNLEGAKNAAAKIVTKENMMKVGGYILETLSTVATAMEITNAVKSQSTRSDLFDLSYTYANTPQDKSILSMYKLASKMKWDSDKVRTAKDIAEKALNSDNENTRKLAIDMLCKLAEDIKWDSDRTTVMRLINRIGDA